MVTSDEELKRQLAKEWQQAALIIKRLAAQKELEDIRKQKEFVNHNSEWEKAVPIIKRLAAAAHVETNQEVEDKQLDDFAKRHSDFITDDIKL
jgi:oligoendopeptidase F